MITLPWGELEVVTVGEQVVNGGNLYSCATAGTTGDSTGPTGTGSGIVDGTAVWNWVSLAWGMMPQGFFSKPLSQVKTDLETRLKAGPLGASAGTNPDGSIPTGTVAGQIIALVTDPVAAAWDLLQALTSSTDPGQATGASQDAVCSITGVVREPAGYSSVVETCTGIPGTVLPVGRVVTVATTGTTPGTAFATTAPATIASVPAWDNNSGAGRAYVFGQRVTSSGNVYQCVLAGTGSTTTGPSGTGTAIVDGTVNWAFLGQGTGAVDVGVQAQVLGALGASPFTLTTIGTPVFGWQGASNVLAATQGTLQETDTALRVRREQELHADGLAAADAIRAKVLTVGAGTSLPVTTCTVFVNDTDLTIPSSDTTGHAQMPPHSVFVLADYNSVGNELDDAIGQAIWDAVGAGIATTFAAATGGSAKTSMPTDSQGVTQTVYWARPTLVPIYVAASVTYDNTPGAFPSNGALALANAIVVAGANYPNGKNVWASSLIASLFDGPTTSDPGALPVPGVLDVPTLYIGTSASPSTSTPISISPIQRATFPLDHITGLSYSPTGQVDVNGATP